MKRSRDTGKGLGGSLSMWHPSGGRKKLLCTATLCGNSGFPRVCQPGLPNLRVAKARQLFLIIMVKQDFNCDNVHIFFLSAVLK